MFCVAAFKGCGCHAAVATAAGVDVSPEKEQSAGLHMYAVMTVWEYSMIAELHTMCVLVHKICSV
jgi:hypothetical protein